MNDIKKAYYKKITFHFNFEARTSRDTLSFKDSYFIIIEGSNKKGIGECSPIPGLSIDNISLFEDKLKDICRAIIKREKNYSDLDKFPSIKFGLEMAFMDYNNEFVNSTMKIKINGLVWMGDIDLMKKQVNEKINEGFNCIKIKVGALDFKKELGLIEWIRKEFNNKIEIRLDANGALKKHEVIRKLEELSHYNIHSIEQPVKAGQLDLMKEIVAHSPVPVALDEELIGINGRLEKRKLLETILPHFIILKPSLLGGFKECEEWIEIADSLKIDWWITSALESNIGLNAIAQWVCQLNNKNTHGLGTGTIYRNNIQSPLIVNKGILSYSSNIDWDRTCITR